MKIKLESNDFERIDKESYYNNNIYLHKSKKYKIKIVTDELYNTDVFSIINKHGEFEIGEVHNNDYFPGKDKTIEFDYGFDFT